MNVRQFKIVPLIAICIAVICGCDEAERKRLQQKDNKLKQESQEKADKESGKGSASGSSEVTNSEDKDDYVSYYEKWLRDYVRNTEASTGHQLGENYVQKELNKFKKMTPKEQKEQIELMKRVLQR